MADKRISQLIERTDIANNDVLPIVASGATTTNKVTISTIQDYIQENIDLGVTSVGITLGTTGTDVNVTGSPVTSSGNITINLPTASATNRGALSSADWTTFNSKQPAGNYTTTDTTQTITGVKTFSQDIFVNSRRIGRGSGDITSNTVVGNSALRDNTTGSENSAFGGGALRQITTGSANTAIGFFSMLNSETGAGNVAIGNGTLQGNNGSNNVAVGNQAGAYIAGGTTLNTTCLNSVYIGTYTGPSANGNTNEIVIGQNAIGQGSNTVTIGNSSTTSNKLFGRLIHANAVNADESATLGQVTTSLGNYVTLNTAQTITGQKTFNSSIVGQDATLTSSGGNDTLIVTHTSGSGIAVDISKAGNGEGLRVAKTSGSGNAVTITGGNLEAPTIVKTGGTSSQFLKADGSVDSSTYLTTDTTQSISGVKTFSTGSLILAAAGTANSTHLRNSAGDSTSVSGSNVFGFNSSNKIYVTTESNGGFIFDFSNTSSNKIYTLKDASGTLAFTSDISTAVAGYLPLTGGTLTGALIGTTATFSASTSTNLVVERTSGNGARIELKDQSTNSVFFAANNGDFQLQTPSGGYTNKLTIANSGEATFSGALNGTSASFSGAFGTNAGISVSGTTYGYLSTNRGSSAASAGIAYNSVGSLKWFVGITENTDNFQFYSSATNNFPLILSASTGAATFSSSVSAGGKFISTMGNNTEIFLSNTATTGYQYMSFKNTSGQMLLGVEGTAAGSLQTGNSAYSTVLTTVGSTDLSLGANQVERMRITSGGNVIIQSTAVAGLFSGENSNSGATNLQSWNKATSGDNKFVEFYTEGGTGTLRGSIDYNRAAGLVRYNVTSDKNLKNIIGDSDKNKSIEILNSTRIREYSWKEDESNKSQIGVIAQELHETFKGAVSVGSDEELLGTEEYKPWGVDKTAFTFHLVAGFQEHERIIKELQSQIDSLKNQIK
jgi:hypothetical protein